jgi:DNA-binding protein HU-beta
MTDLTDYVKSSTGFGESTIAAVMNSVINFLSTSLRSGGVVKIENLGIFNIVDRPERQGRNPRTGEQTTFKASRKPKVKFTKSFLTEIQPDPLVENSFSTPTPPTPPTPIPVTVTITPDVAAEIPPISAELLPPISAELLPRSLAQPSEAIEPKYSWQIKAPDGTFIEVSTSDLPHWGVTKATPIYSLATGWQLAGKVPELAGIVA